VQRKFNTLERAEEFLGEIRREWANTGKIKLGLDSSLHNDVLRAVKVLSGVANATLERAAHVYMQCRSMAEKRGSGFEVARDRVVELSPRIFLMVQNEAVVRNTTIREVVEGFLGAEALRRAQERIEQQAADEAREYLELEEEARVDLMRLAWLRRRARRLARARDEAEKELEGSRLRIKVDQSKESEAKTG
jgi:hypothetical protein